MITTQYTTFWKTLDISFVFYSVCLAPATHYTVWEACSQRDLYCGPLSQLSWNVGMDLLFARYIGKQEHHNWQDQMYYKIKSNFSPVFRIAECLLDRLFDKKCFFKYSKMRWISMRFEFHHQTDATAPWFSVGTIKTVTWNKIKSLLFVCCQTGLMAVAQVTLRIGGTQESNILEFVCGFVLLRVLSSPLPRKYSYWVAIADHCVVHLIAFWPALLRYEGWKFKNFWIMMRTSVAVHVETFISVAPENSWFCHWYQAVRRCRLGMAFSNTSCNGKNAVGGVGLVQCSMPRMVSSRESYGSATGVASIL